MPVNVKTICFFILTYLFCSLGSAQIKTRSRHYTTADGLSDNRITSIIKDKDGFMWFGSWVGVSRFDGYKFSIFKSFPGDHSPLNSNRIDNIVEDPQGRYLWVKVYDNHIYRFDKYTGRFIDLSTLLRDSLIQKEVFTSILGVKNDLVWLKSRTTGIILITNSSGPKPGYLRFGKEQKVGFRLPSNEIVFFKVDKFKNVWVGTDAGLSLFRVKGQGRYTQAILPSSLSNIPFAGITQAKGQMWIATLDGRLIATDHTLRKTKIYHIAKSPLNHVVYSPKSHLLYATTSSGELISIDEKGTTKHMMKTADRSPLSHIYEDKTGVLWLESERYGLIRFNLQTGFFQYLLPIGRYRSLPWKRSSTYFQDKQGIVWVNSRENGLMFFDPEAKRLKLYAANPDLSFGQLTNSYARLYYDTTGVLWMGTGHNGIQKVVFQEPDFKQHAPNPQSTLRSKNEVRGIYADKQDRLWFGTKDGELHVHRNGKPLNDLFLNNMPKVPSGVYSILEDSKGNIWLGTKSDGLIKMHPTNRDGSRYKAIHYLQDTEQNQTGRAIYCLLEDRKGRLWAGSYEEGLIQIEERDGKTTFKTIDNFFFNYPKGNTKRVRHLAEDSRGRIWIGTTDGLLIFDPAVTGPTKQHFKIIRKEQGNIKSLGGNDVQYIFRDSHNNMWILTSAGGLNLACEDSKGEISFINFSSKNGLPSDGMVSCQEDSSGNLWIATQNGISKFNLKDKSIQNFNHNDGIHEATLSEASCTKMRNGNLVYGTAYGYLSFDPAKIRLPQNSANLAITKLYVNGEELTPAENIGLKFDINYIKKLVLDHNQNGISIEFAVLDYRFTGGESYACRLLGFDNKWRNTEGQRRATYTNLPPGNYIFEVKCLNKEAFTQTPLRALNINILPPFWKTWWAYLIYLFTVLLILVIIRKVTISFLKLRQDIEVEKRLADLKLNFFTQISHELRTPLTLITNPSEEVLHSEKLSTKGREHMRVVVKNARRMVRLVNQVLDLQKVQSGNVSLQVVELEIHAFILGVLEYFKESLDNQNISIKIINNDSPLIVWADADKLEIIFYNVIANAIKFSPRNSTIMISIDHDPERNSIRIEVADEGPGVKSSELEDIFKLYYEGDQSSKNIKGSGIGLALSRELIQLHTGKIEAQNNNNGGLTIIIEMKQGKEHLDPISTRFILEPYNLKLPDKELQVITDKELQVITDKESETPEENASTILIVEDNDDLRTFLSNKLSEFYHVETAHDGNSGLKKATDVSPDLILSDIMMPGMDGIQMLDHIKNTPATSHIPVVLLTAKDSVESQVQGLLYGADYYLTKPIEIGLLRAALSNILGQRQRLFQSILEDHPQPTTNEATLITAYDQEFLQKVIRVVENKLDDSEFNIDFVADSLSMSRSAFFKKIKSLTNLAPVEFVREIRLQKAKEIFDAGEDNISVVSYKVGFNNPKYFSTCFKIRYNQTPSAYLKNMKEAKKH